MYRQERKALTMHGRLGGAPRGALTENFLTPVAKYLGCRSQAAFREYTGLLSVVCRVSSIHKDCDITVLVLPLNEVFRERARNRNIFMLPQES